jgi:hypothetical protein
MDKATTRRLVLFFSIFVGIILIGAIMAIQVNAQNQSSNDIAERLKQKGVPLKHVVTFRRIPYEIEIALNSTSDSGNLALEDNWFIQLANREATMAYRIGVKINSFKLKAYNTKGELIYSTQTYLYPDDINQELPVPSYVEVDNLRTKEIVSGKLQLAGLALDILDITPEDNIRGLGQVLMIQVSTANLETANRSLPTFLSSLFQMLDTINIEQGTYIVLCHLRVMDSQGTVLLDYVRDLEAGATQWTGVTGLYDDWYPHPEPAPTEGPEPVITEPVIPPTQGANPPASTPYL